MYDDPAGARHHPAAFTQQLRTVRNELSHLASKPGHRFADFRSLVFSLIDTTAGYIARSALGSRARPVRAVLFDKTPDANWSLAWHQDRTIAVQQRADLPNFQRWTTKQGILHVEPPFEMLSGMITLRLHIDDVTKDNAPLIIAPGSHRFGLIAEDQVAHVLNQCGRENCLANAGDIWSYSTPILHASQASYAPEHRRVLQVDYSADDLPEPLQWLPV